MADVELSEEQLRAELTTLLLMYPNPPQGSLAESKIARLKALLHEEPRREIAELNERVERLEKRVQAMNYAMAAVAYSYGGGEAQHVNFIMFKALECAPFDWEWKLSYAGEEPPAVAGRIAEFLERCAEKELG